MKTKNIVIITALITSLIGTPLAVALLYLNLKLFRKQLTPIEIGNCFFPSLIIYGVVVIINIVLVLIVKLWNVERMKDSQSIDNQLGRLSKVLGWINSLNAFPFGLLSAIFLNAQGSGVVSNASVALRTK